MTLIPERKALLVAALTSGEYKQATGALRYEDGFCCLGVACDVYRKQTGEGNWTDRRGQIFTDEHGNNSRVSLPAAVWTWFGFKGTEDDKVTIDGNTDWLTQHNDTGKTFAQIAAAIQEQL